MWLAYGLNTKEEIIHVSEVKRGKSALACPYCGGLLTAKKGRVKAHHFAHTSKTCKTAGSYDFYDITQEVFPVEMGLYAYAIRRKQEMETQYIDWQQELAALTESVAAANAEISEAKQLLTDASTPYKNGKRPKNREKNRVILMQLEYFLRTANADLPHLYAVRHSTFKTYVRVTSENWQNSRVPVSVEHKLRYRTHELWQYERYEHMRFVPERLANLYVILPEYWQNKSRLSQRQDDLASFEREQERFQQFTLYFLEIQAPEETYYKIGITGRTVDDRLKEVEQDARKLGKVEISIKHQVKGYAFLETFFKHKYADYRIDFDTHTEYFMLPADVLKEIKTDLGRLEYLSLDRIGKIKAGMQQAKEAGKRIGRPAKEEKAAAFLRKPKSQEIAALLDQGLSLREVQRQTGYSINTVRKVNSLRDSYK